MQEKNNNKKDMINTTMKMVAHPFYDPWTPQPNPRFKNRSGSDF